MIRDVLSKSTNNCSRIRDSRSCAGGANHDDGTNPSRSASAVGKSSWALSRPPRWHWWLTGVIVAIYIIFSVLGLTTSNLGAKFAHGPNSTTIGPTASLRSDEYMAGTPMELSIMETGDQATTGPLAEESSVVQRIPIGPVQHLVFWDSTLTKILSFLPDAQMFAASWWLSSLVLLLAMPYWMVLMGGRWNLAWAATFLCVFSPANWWWTFQISDQLGFTVLGCTFLLLAARGAEKKSWKFAAILGILSAICLAGMVSRYLVWSLILGGGVLLATSVKILHRWRDRSLLTLISTGAVTLILALAVLWEGRRGMAALTAAVYPGQRLTTGEASDMGWTFSANFFFSLSAGQVRPVSAPYTYASNISELSTSWNFLLLIIPFALVLAYQTQRIRDRLPEIALGLWCMLWFAWGFVGTGGFGVKIPLLNSVPAARTIQIIGALFAIWLMLTLSKIKQRQLSIAITGSAVVGMILLHSGSELLLRYVPSFSYKEVLLWSLVGAIVTFVLLYAPRSSWALIASASLGLSSVIATPPLQIGLGSLRGTQTANRLSSEGQEAREKGELWATDTMAGNALLIANGVPTLSGLLRSGPVEDEWLKLDPSGRFKENWSRGGGYIFFKWSLLRHPFFTNPNYDVVEVYVNPCTLAEIYPELTTIVSDNRMSGAGLECLVPAGEIHLQDLPQSSASESAHESASPTQTASAGTSATATAQAHPSGPSGTSGTGKNKRSGISDPASERHADNTQYVYKIQR